MNKALLEKRIGFTLPDNLLDDIPFEAGFSPVLKESFEKNQFFVDWGHSIIRTACAFYLYRNDQSSTIEDINKRIKSVYLSVESEIYSTYKLKDFVVRSNAAKGNSYPEITSKLIVMIYMQHGFLAVNTLLEPLFNFFHNSQKVDRAKIIEKYAKYRNQKLSYSTSYLSGRFEEKIYRCRISIGSQYAEGRGIGINNAQTDAEINFFQKYKNSIEQFLSDQKLNKKSRSITEERKKQLIDAVKLLSLNGKYLSYGQMDEILIHSSFSNIPKNQMSKNNTMLSGLGNQILGMLAYEYCYRHSIFSSAKHDEIIHENNLSLCLSENYLKYLLRTPYIISENNKGIMKVEVFQGIVASYWINYLVKEDEIISGCAKDSAHEKLAMSDLINRADYYTFAKEIVKITGWNISEAIKKNQRKFQSSITVSGVYWTQTGIGIADTADSSIKLASKDVLGKIIRYCDKPDVAASIQNKITKAQPINGPVGVGPTIPPGTGGTGTGPKPKPQPPEEVSFDSSENTLYIFKGTISCRKKGHTITQATGLLVKLDGTAAKINVNYCASCKQYFIGLSEYEHYRGLYGALLGNFAFRNFNFASGKGFGNLADESPLHLCGYTVRQDANLSMQKRRLILENIMDHHILEKDQIMNYLRFFIASNSSQKNKQAAVQKWTEDLDWVRNYKINKQRHFLITKIKKA